jgi:hypothetical protein
MENGLEKLFECLQSYCADLRHLLKELQRRTVDLKYFVAGSTSDEYFEQYSLKSMPIKNCINAIGRNLSKHPKEMFWYSQYFKDAIKAIFRLCGGRTTPLQKGSSPNSSPTRVPSNSLHRILKKGSLSSVEILPLPEVLRSGASKHQNDSSGMKEFWVEDELSEFSNKKNTTEQELSESEELSVYPIFVGKEKEGGEVQGKRQRRTFSGVSSNSGSLLKVSPKKKIRVKIRKAPTPKARGVTLKNFVDEAANVYRAENPQTELRFSGSNNKQMTLRGGQRRYHKVKPVHHLKRSRSRQSKKALLEGLGFSASSYKGY